MRPGIITALDTGISVSTHRELGTDSREFAVKIKDNINSFYFFLLFLLLDNHE